MNELTLLFLILLTASTSLQIWLARRQIKAIRQHQDTVPVAFSEKITVADHQKAAAYTVAKVRFGSKMLITEAILLLLWTIGGLLQVLDLLWRTLEWPSLWTGVAVFTSFLLISAILDLPASIYQTFFIEARFGFNRTTVRLFIADTIKSLILLLIIGIPLTTVILGLMEFTGPWWWLWVWSVWIGFSLLMLWAYPTFIAPLFNKFLPLEEGELKQRIEALLERNGFTSEGIFVMDGSRRSGHGNAYFTGLGNHKRIVFFDTLLNGLIPEEIEAVLAHEIGHFKLKHLQKRLIWMASVSLCGLALLGWLMQQWWFYFGLGIRPEYASTYTALLLFMLVMPVFTFFVHPLLAWFSRRHEFAADDFAAQQIPPQLLVQALVKLYKDNASTLTPDPLYSAFYDSHPPAPVRVAHLTHRESTV